MDSQQTPQGTYEAPTVVVVGNLHQLTQTNKVFSSTNDFTYPTIVTKTYGPLNFS